MTLSLNLRGNVWHVQGTVKNMDGDTVRVRRSTGFTKPERRYAQVIMNKITEDALHGRLADKSGVEYVADVVDAYINRVDPPGKTDILYAEKLKRSLGSIKLSDAKLSDFMYYFSERKIAANTMAREMNTANAMLTYARDVCGMEVPDIKLKRPSYNDDRTRWLYKTEMDSLIENCPPEIKLLVTFLFYTGARLGEATSLRWSGVVGNSAIFSSIKGKGKKIRRRAIVLSPTMLEAMGERGKSNEYVFKNVVGSKWQRGNFYEYFNPTCEVCGIEDFHPHDCRHTFASHLVQKGASLGHVAELLGHASLQMVMRYAHLGPSHLESTVSLLWDTDTNLTHTQC